MLEVSNLNVVFNRGTPDEMHALRDFSLTLPTGAFATIVGSNGAGKSTLINSIAGTVSPDTGTVKINGANVTNQAEYRRAASVARVFSDPLAGTVGEMSIEDNVAMAMLRGHRRTFRLASTRKRREAIQRAVEPLGLGLEERLPENVKRLSSGQRQSLTLAMACAQAPKVLLLDEHLSALDPVTHDRVSDLTVDFAERAGCVTIMVTHSMEDAIKLGDHMLVMNAGRLVALFSGEEKRNMTVPELIGKVRDAGGTLSDRSLLEEMQ